MATRAGEVVVERQAGALGAYVTGVDLAAGLDDGVVADLRSALLEHLVICIRGQSAVTSAGQLEFAASADQCRCTPTCRPSKASPVSCGSTTRTR